jgi:hypothetical protein
MTKSLIIFLFLLLSQSVFSFSAQDGQDKFDASFSLPGRRTNIYNCMSATVNTGCWSLEAKSDQLTPLAILLSVGVSISGITKVSKLNLIYCKSN